ncbi:MAG: hypothetical protein ACOXZS_05045 [Bacilli bacterium]|jgi:hypothetical protein
MLVSIVDKLLKIYNNLYPYGLIIIILVTLSLLSLIILLMIIKDNSKSKKENEKFELIEEESDSNNIGVIAKRIEEEIENDVINLTNFEEKQEEESIISYEELIQKARENPENNVNQVDTNIKEETSKFVNTPVISPIFGYTEETAKKEKAKEYIRQIIDKNETLLEEPINETIKPIENNIIKQKEEFLEALKKLKNNLN